MSGSWSPLRRRLVAIHVVGFKWWLCARAAECRLLDLALAQPASASICERINSEFEFVKDRRRNRLSHDKANKLVSLFHNLRLLKRMKNPQYSEPMIAWGDSEELDVDRSRVITKWSAAGFSGGGPSKLLAARK